MTKESFFLRLKKHREKLGISQKDLAQSTRVSATTVQSWERDVYPKGDALILLASSLSCSVDWLLMGDDSDGQVGYGFNRVTKQKNAEPAEKTENIYNADNFKITDMITKTMEILESETIFRTALASNINAFHQALKFESDQKARDDRMAEMERRMDAQAKRQDEQDRRHAEHARRYAEIEAENDRLRNIIEGIGGNAAAKAVNHR